MGMQETPCNGYVIEVHKLSLAVMPESLPRFNQLLEEDCDGDIADFLNKNMKPGLPTPVYVYTLTDEDTAGDDMEIGETYAVFDESDLYELVPKSTAVMLETHLGELPKDQNWIVFG